MKIYTISKSLKNRLAKEMAKAPDKATFHGAIAREVYPELKHSALVIGDKVELISYK